MVWDGVGVRSFSPTGLQESNISLFLAYYDNLLYIMWKEKKKKKVVMLWPILVSSYLINMHEYSNKQETILPLKQLEKLNTVLKTILL